MKRLIIGMSGASGLIYGIRMLEALREHQGIETHLVMTSAARLNIALETDWDANDVIALADQVHSVKDLAASVASGSFRTDGMIIAPCSMKTLSAVVNSYTDNLLTRAADVVLKERRRLVLMPRETPLHAGHCELLLKATQIGAIVAPPMPAWYAKPKTLDDIVNHNVGRVLDLFDIDTDLVTRWEGASVR
ncbi:MAG: UbiX family flavin prenyltransferase [Pseudohongiella nitratireducens]|nr:UbiX family flavin prenyltransferase [Pseudohongiella nitratireducens]MDF1623205.1 UbiX family flavin prenyltransferase [Pseudohongiella nitratireducens]